jgi:hypothetical protein
VAAVPAQDGTAAGSCRRDAPSRPRCLHNRCAATWVRQARYAAPRRPDRICSSQPAQTVHHRRRGVLLPDPRRPATDLHRIRSCDLIRWTTNQLDQIGGELNDWPRPCLNDKTAHYTR